VASAIQTRYLRLGDGDGEAAKAHVARAMALLQMKPITIPPANHEPRQRPREIPRGGLALWQARRIAAHVEANLAGKIHIKDLAGLLDISSSHFSRAFKCTFGVTAHGWLLRRRIEVAQGLMLTTDSTLTEIAHSCGMADHAHFTHRFRRLVGETPYAWRRMRRG
jgi:AraC family transcriptional regulator